MRQAEMLLVAAPLQMSEVMWERRGGGGEGDARGGHEVDRG